MPDDNTIVPMTPEIATAMAQVNEVVDRNRDLVLAPLRQARKQLSTLEYSLELAVVELHAAEAGLKTASAQLTPADTQLATYLGTARETAEAKRRVVASLEEIMKTQKDAVSNLKGLKDVLRNEREGLAAVVMEIKSLEKAGAVIEEKVERKRALHALVVARRNKADDMVRSRAELKREVSRLEEQVDVFEQWVALVKAGVPGVDRMRRQWGEFESFVDDLRDEFELQEEGED
ncbi:hypothetical protein CONLIGDRAFT_686660 [Coniochaeta ligniaria NRRL 30616]|uniref:Uncharacterized protein n=1 Tax=Coniochaeta ligniaria NRRL 30616 TaxID=1408157 RepID=A0A1J7I717_9PEZI|nr:hypothetical protein CONLIGDRAFT_686660 [Coniochaeta ligniaria NRRL 30616]